MPTTKPTMSPGDALAEALAVFGAALAEAVEEQRRRDVYGFAVESLIKGHDLCAAVALDTLTPKELNALVEVGHRLAFLAADTLSSRPKHRR